jgi:hypothetical protein
MKKFVLAVALIAAVGGFTRALASDTTTVKGYLMDVSCATKHPGDAGFAEGHDKDCLQMCAKSGYGVLTDEGTFVKFDADGNKKVEKFIKETDTDSDWKVQVNGELKGEMLTVASISLQSK